MTVGIISAWKARECSNWKIGFSATSNTNLCYDRSVTSLQPRRSKQENLGSNRSAVKWWSIRVDDMARGYWPSRNKLQRVISRLTAWRCFIWRFSVLQVSFIYLGRLYWDATNPLFGSPIYNLASFSIKHIIKILSETNWVPFSASC